MKLYICNNCENKYEVEDNIIKTYCEKCGNILEEIGESNKTEIDAIIDSIIEDAIEQKNSKIINLNNEKSIILNDECIIKRINDKCIDCGQCKKTCENVANIKYDLNKCKKSICIGCGQCIKSCPSKALYSERQYKEVKKIINENKKVMVAILTPEIEININKIYDIEGNRVKKVISALKKMGFDFVFSGAFGSDLYVMELVGELSERLSNNKKLPLLSSSCPAWVEYAEIYHPELLDNISTCKNPLNMQSELIKTYFAKEKGFDPSKIITVGFTVCTAKKMKRSLATDFTLSLEELDYLIKEEEIKLKDLEEKNFDKLLSDGSLYGKKIYTTGGETKALISTLYKIITKRNIDEKVIDLNNIISVNGIQEISVQLGDRKINIAIVEQMQNLEYLLINNKYKNYHYIEIMNCKSGCINGGDSIINKGGNEDFILSDNVCKFPYDNIELKDLFKTYLINPYSKECIDKLHTSYSDKSKILDNK